MVRIGQIQEKRDVGISAGKLHERFSQEVRAEIRGHVHPQRSGGRIDQLLQFFMGDLRFGDDALAAFEVQPARVGQFHLARGAAEQPQANGSL
ncbi:hypothetical protein D3C78_1707710 [compost metagenome]